MLSSLPLLQMIPKVRPDWKIPWHLQEWCECIEGSLGGGMRAMCSVPFQHYKSSTTLMGVVWLLLRNPALRILIITHTWLKAKAMSKELHELWGLAVELRDSDPKRKGAYRKGFNTIEDWQTPEQGGCVVMSVEQSKHGYPCDILLVDDPLDENMYLERRLRDAVDEAIGWYTTRAATHLDSVLIVASRWTPDDPIGRRLLREAVEWRYIWYPGIIDYGEPTQRAFAPEVLSLERHLQMRRELFEIDPSGKRWYAQVQNQPLPPELGFFPGETLYHGAIPGNTEVMFGVDAAFTSGPKSDYFAVVGCVYIGSAVVVFRVIRHQRGLASGLETLQSLKREFPACRFVSYVSGAEKGIYDDYFLKGGIEVEKMPARYAKDYRAQKCAKAWRDKQVHVLSGQPWTRSLITECNLFDGSKDGIDDQVDALVAAYDAIMMGHMMADFGTTFTFGHPVM